MKFEIKLENIKIEELGMNIGGIELKGQYSLSELQGGYGLIQEILTDIPNNLELIKKGFDKFNEISKTVEEEEAKEIDEQFIKAKRKIEQITETWMKLSNISNISNISEERRI